MLRKGPTMGLVLGCCQGVYFLTWWWSLHRHSLFFKLFLSFI